VPLKAPLPPVVDTVAAVVHGPDGEVLYLNTTEAPLGTAVVADTWPENAMPVWDIPTGVGSVFNEVVVG
jgi:hypothetical protein